MASVKLLLVTWYFPPANTIGAVRMGKFAKYLGRQGYDFRVLTGRDWGLPETLPLEIDPGVVHSARHRDLNEMPRPARALRDWLKRRGQPVQGTLPRNSSAEKPVPSNEIVPKGTLLVQKLSALYRDAVHFPDRQVGWAPYAMGAARRLFRSWRPDLIYASVPPYTSLFVAAWLARRYGVPWVAEYRDRWCDDPYIVMPRWRAWLEHTLERRLMQQATGIVTVSEPWADIYRSKYGRPTRTIYNGYDAEDLPNPAPLPKPGPVRIVYTGAIYIGFRDPTPLFAALAKLPHLRDDIRVEFYGTAPEHVLPLAAQAGIGGQVSVLPGVPFRQSIVLQHEADVLLLMQWNNPLEQGNVPAKLFEYMATGRPILGLGIEDGVPARLIAARGAGFYTNDPDAIAGQLARWVVEKRTTGSVAAVDAAARSGLARDEQFASLLGFLEPLATQRVPAGRHETEAGLV
jgi:glycosyltransferase involved in cell wall biosynthesis